METVWCSREMIKSLISKQDEEKDRAISSALKYFIERTVKRWKELLMNDLPGWGARVASMSDEQREQGMVTWNV